MDMDSVKNTKGYISINATFAYKEDIIPEEKDAAAHYLASRMKDNDNDDRRPKNTDDMWLILCNKENKNGNNDQRPDEFLRLQFMKNKIHW